MKVTKLWKQMFYIIGNNSSNPILQNIPGRKLYEGTVLHSSEVGDGSILNENNAAAI